MSAILTHPKRHYFRTAAIAVLVAMALFVLSHDHDTHVGTTLLSGAETQTLHVGDTVGHPALALCALTFIIGLAVITAKPTRGQHVVQRRNSSTRPVGQDVSVRLRGRKLLYELCVIRT